MESTFALHKSICFVFISTQKNGDKFENWLFSWQTFEQISYHGLSRQDALSFQVKGQTAKNNKAICYKEITR